MRKRLAMAALCLALLWGCSPAGEPATPTTEVAAAVSQPTSTLAPSATSEPADPTSTATVVLTATPSSEPSPSAAPTATLVPSPTATVDPVVLDDLQRGYVTLVFLESTMGALDELALRLQEGTMESLEAGFGLLALTGLLGAVKDAVEADAPTRSLAPAWEKAREALAVAVDVTVRWLDKEITSADVPDLLGPGREHLSVAFDRAGSLMKTEYGVTDEQLNEFRAQTEAEFRSIYDESASTTP